MARCGTIPTKTTLYGQLVPPCDIATALLVRGATLFCGDALLCVSTAMAFGHYSGGMANGTGTAPVEGICRSVSAAQSRVLGLAFARIGLVATAFGGK